MRGWTGLALGAGIAGLLAGVVLATPGTAVAGGLAGGTWGTPVELNLPGNDGGSIQDVSCVSPGNCAAIGNYGVIAGNNFTPYEFVINETDGTWGPVTTVKGTSNTDPPGGGSASVSCTAAGDCVAAWTGYLVTESSGTWGKAQSVALGTGGTNLLSVTCAATGDCAAIGVYQDISTGHEMPFVMDSTSGTWDAPQAVTGVAALTPFAVTSAILTSVSCASAGNCVAGGSYQSSDGGQPFLVTETDGSWGPAELVPGITTLDTGNTGNVTSVSCDTSGDCVATGQFTYEKAGYDYPWVANESDGTWDSAQQLAVPATTFFDAYAQASACSARGYCVIAGSYLLAAGDSYEAFVATYSDGTWTSQALPGETASGSGAIAVSCDATGDCTVGGYSYPAGFGGYQPFVANEVDGTWGSLQVLSGNGANAVSGLSCSAPGYCIAIGNIGPSGAFIASEATAASVTLKASTTTLTYGDEERETLTAAVTSPSGGTPDGTVTVTDGSLTACTITLTDGTGTCTLPAVAVPSGSDELTATYDGDTSYTTASTTGTVTVITATSRTAVTISPATVTFGTKYKADISVTVAPKYAGTPTGDVAVYLNGNSLGSLALVGGKASGLTVPTGLKTGRYAIMATYPGDRNFADSTATGYLTVVREKTTTRLVLSKVSVTYGHENSERLTVTVTPGDATGKVTVKAGATTVCVITLKSGKGTCTLRASQLKRGTYHLIARYPGDSNNLSSASASTTLKVAA
jgi:hypothetical protein